jgi:hypothetical protein
MDPGEPSLSFLQLPLPPTVDLRLVAIPAGVAKPYLAEEWDDSLVVVERGAVELECLRGGRRAFPTGAVIFLAGLPLRTIHNPGAETALLAAVSRISPKEKTA